MRKYGDISKSQQRTQTTDHCPLSNCWSCSGYLLVLLPFKVIVTITTTTTMTRISRSPSSYLMTSKSTKHMSYRPKIHPVISVTHLEKCPQGKDPWGRDADEVHVPTNDERFPGETRYEVDRILGEKVVDATGRLPKSGVRKKIRKFLVGWRGQSEKQDQWIRFQSMQPRRNWLNVSMPQWPRDYQNWTQLWRKWRLKSMSRGQ